MTARYAQRDMHIMHIDISIIPPSSRGGMRDHFGPKRNNCSWDIHEPRNQNLRQRKSSARSACFQTSRVLVHEVKSSALFMLCLAIPSSLQAALSEVADGSALGASRAACF